MENFLTDQEAKLMAVTLEILNEWAGQWIAVADGHKTRDEAFDDFDAFLRPVGSMFAVALSLPGVEDHLNAVKAEHVASFQP